MIVPLPAIAASQTGPGEAPKPRQDLRKAATDFEAIILTEMLRTVRFGAPGGEARDQAASTLLDFGHEQIARAIAAAGGLGLASFATSNLESSTPENHVEGRISGALRCN